MRSKPRKSDERKRLKAPLVQAPAVSRKEVRSQLPEFLVWRGTVKSRAYVGCISARTPDEARKLAIKKWPEYSFKAPAPNPGHIDRRLFILPVGEGGSSTTSPSETALSSRDEWNRRFQEGLRQDSEWFQQVRASAQKDDDMKTKEKTKSDKKSTKSEEKSEKKTTSAAGEVKRQDWNGVGMCALIRYCGKKGFGKQKTLKVMESLGLEPNPATITIQLKKGTKGESVPTLGKEAKEEFNSTADDIPNDEKKKSKSSDGKKTVAKKSDGKKPGKKINKKHDDDDQDAAEAQAEADSADEEVDDDGADEDEEA